MPELLTIDEVIRNIKANSVTLSDAATTGAGISGRITTDLTASRNRRYVFSARDVQSVCTRETAASVSAALKATHSPPDFSSGEFTP